MEQFQILWVAKSQTAPGNGVKAHTHPYYHMLYIQNGACRVEVGGDTHVLSQGWCILIPPDTEHSFSNEDPVSLDYLEIKFVMERSVTLRVSDSPLAGSLFQQIVREYPALGALADKPAAAYLSALLCALTQKERLEETERFRYVDAASFGELTRNIVRYLEEHYQQELRLDDIAHSMGYNKSYLCVAFKKDAGFTILDCLNTIRIRRAAELIVYSDHSLAQVADMCGFTSVSHFNRVFAKYVGITPGQCRRAYPAGILFGDRDLSDSAQKRSDRFVYSALAHKTITPQMIRELDLNEKSE